MTIQELKDNKEAIINRINEIADASKTKEIMTAMVNVINGGMNEANDAVELVDEVVALLGYEKKYKGRHMDDIMVDAAKRQMSSSLRK
jgi:uncharacterized protein YqgV (UPF0045/DUF77 family)